MSPRFYVHPTNENDPIVYVEMKIDDFELLSHECNVRVLKYDDNEVLCGMTNVHIPPKIYSEWATDDYYIIEYVLDELGLVLKQEIEIEFY